MKKYVVAIEEMIVKEFEVSANSSDEAIESSIKKYKDGEFILDDVDVSFRQVSVVKPTASEWVEF